jgi:benzoylformate decarboxylase
VNVRDATFEVFRRRGMTTLFANPGSTEVPFLVDLPPDLRFVLGLHESSVVGMATGWALARREPALAILHTTAGLGNAVAALATARVNRAPIVVVVGQQDRRHLALEPFLAGHLDRLAGDYPVWVDQPVRAQDVPGAVSRAWHEATTGRGPALVIVPMDDWSAPADADEHAAPGRIVRAAAADPDAVAELAELIAGARAPAFVAGAGADDEETWAALVELAERLDAPVWQESFGGRAGFPQDHRLFAGHLPADRTRLREALAPHDLVVAIGAPVFRQYPYDSGPLVPADVRVVLVTDEPEEAHRSPAELVLLAPPAAVAAELAQQVPARARERAPLPRGASTPAKPAPGETLSPAHVLAALDERLPRNAILVEETPSSRPELHARVAAREPFGFVSAAMGGLGFALPGSIGIRMATPDRPVVAVVGDGSSLYSIQALWSAAHYGVGVLFVILSNGGYAVMDRLAERSGGTPPWPRFREVDVAGLATALGCPAQRIERHDDLVAAFDESVPRMAERNEPLLLDIAVADDETFAP